MSRLLPGRNGADEGRVRVIDPYLRYVTPGSVPGLCLQDGAGRAEGSWNLIVLFQKKD